LTGFQSVPSSCEYRSSTQGLFSGGACIGLSKLRVADSNGELRGLKRHSGGSKVLKKRGRKKKAHSDAPYLEAELYAIGADVDGDAGNVSARSEIALVIWKYRFPNRGNQESIFTLNVADPSDDERAHSCPLTQR